MRSLRKATFRLAHKRPLPKIDSSCQYLDVGFNLIVGRKFENSFSDEESEASSWDPMDECGFSSRSTSPISIGEAPEGVVSVPTHISSNLAIDDIGSSIKPSLSYLLPVVPRNSETKENDDRERANPIKMKKIGRECPSESSESSSSEDEEGQEEEEDFQHFLIQKDPPMSVVEQWPDYEQSSYCP